MNCCLNKSAQTIILFVLTFFFSIEIISAQKNTIDGIIKLFDNYDVVAIGERHGGQLDSDFRLDIINHKDFPNKVNDIIIEFGNSKYQKRLDDYIFGESPYTKDLDNVWKNTTQVAVWDSPIYKKLIVLVRKINNQLPKHKKIRIVAADQPIDWNKIHNSQDFYNQMSQLTNRGSYTVEVAKREILDKGRKALAIFGYGHIDKNSGQLVSGINRIKPNSAYTIGSARSFFGCNMDYFRERYPNIKNPVLIDLKDSEIVNWRASDCFRFKKSNSGTLYDMIDAIVYFGEIPDERALIDQTIYDGKYGEEIRRRREIINGAREIFLKYNKDND